MKTTDQIPTTVKSLNDQYTKTDGFDTDWIQTVIEYILSDLCLTDDTTITLEQYKNITDIISAKYDPEYFTEYNDHKL